jgi:NitT/TauT family transport system permease protein
MLRTDAKLSWRQNMVLSMLPFILLVGAYLFGAYHLHYQAEHDATHATASTRLMPLPSEMWDGFQRAAIKEDASGNVRLWLDTWASLRRFAIGMGIVAFGVIIGLYMGCFPLVEAIFFRFFVLLDKVSPLVLLPILFIYLGVDELSKVALVVIGVLPGVVLAAYNRVKEIPREQIHKAQTLGASELEIAWSLVLPQIVPKMLGTMRDNFKAAWNYVIAGESVVASVGIGYRIFILRRNVAMDVILPYVIWATLIMFALDFSFQWIERRYRWADK